jgi:O-acetylserine/cysteine efflux transporter
MWLRPIDYAMGVAVPFVWSMGFVYAKAAIDHFPPIFLMSMRFTLAALVLIWFARLPAEMLGRIAAISFVSAAVQYSLIFTGLKGLDASVAAIVVQLRGALHGCPGSAPAGRDGRPAQMDRHCHGL